jgi:hypothetical protein
VFKDTGVEVYQIKPCRHPNLYLFLTGVSTSLRRLFAKNRDNECNGDITTVTVTGKSGAGILALMERLTTGRTVARTAGTALAVAITQYIVAFYSWSLVPGNAAPGAGSDTARVLWIATSFPLFWLVPRNSQMFQVLLVCDAVLWGFAFGWLAPALLRHFRQTT